MNQPRKRASSGNAGFKGKNYNSKNKTNSLNEDQNYNIEYPVRINRYLFLKGYCSRRKADSLIDEGEVTINGNRAVLGQKVQKNDKVEMSSKIKKLPQNYQYHLFYKPRGVISRNPQDDEKSFEDFFKNALQDKLAPVGGLDKDSEGLLFITNDGRIIDKMLNPKYDHEKEYRVRVDKEITDSFINKMSKGVQIEDYRTKTAQVRKIGDKSFAIILTEGKKHQIRRMCAALGYQIRELKRIRIMNLKLSGLFPGQSRTLKIEEKLELLKSVGL